MPVSGSFIGSMRGPPAEHALASRCIVNGDCPPMQTDVVPLLYGREEGVHIDMNDLSDGGLAHPGSLARLEQTVNVLLHAFRNAHRSGTIACTQRLLNHARAEVVKSRAMLAACSRAWRIDSIPHPITVPRSRLLK